MGTVMRGRRMKLGELLGVWGKGCFGMYERMCCGPPAILMSETSYALWTVANLSESSNAAWTTGMGGTHK